MKALAGCLFPVGRALPDGLGEKAALDQAGVVRFSCKPVQPRDPCGRLDSQAGTGVFTGPRYSGVDVEALVLAPGLQGHFRIAQHRLLSNTRPVLGVEQTVKAAA
ncbi:hypothetical protein, partial [Streptomyces sp. NPDC050560]|uniref:hypothetical protein n=1 Tax=Streptomyces sp. NPDC050560 TaxID=3365630 RepID=UPI0037956E13